MLPTPTETIPFTNSLEEVPVGFDRFETLPTADDIKDNYLFGVPIDDDYGNSIKTSTINHFISVAISRFEETFDQPLLPRRFVEPHDYKFQDYAKFCFIQLYHYPIISVDGFEVHVIPPDPTGQTDTSVIGFPVQWMKISKGVGQIQITPNSAAISSFLMSGAGELPRIFAAREYFPDLLYVNYVAGFENNKIPASIVHWICLHASVNLLRIAGDIIYGAGIQNTAIGLGSLSQSIGTTKGQGGAFAGRITDYKEEMKTIEKSLKRFYKGIKIATV